MLHTPLDTQTRSKAFGAVGPAVVYPRYAESGDGASLTCSDGQQVLDLVAGLGAISLGYQDTGVTRAVLHAVNMGSILSLPHRLENEVATLLSEVIPCAEMTRFVMTGSEAMQGAVQIARAVTGKSTVVVTTHSYHGWHEWFQAPQRYDQGIASDYYGKISTHLHTFHDNDGLDLTRTLNDALPDSVAAIIIEPYRFPAADSLASTREKQQRFYAEARQLADKHNALLIFDEMIFGFRHALGGSQELWCESKTIPDIACFGKALGNGVPIAAICGKRDLMREARLVSSTFGGSLLGLSAAKEVITQYRTNAISQRMWERGEILREQFKSYATGTVAFCEGYPVHFRLAGLSETQLDTVLMQAYQQGILLHRSCGNIIAAMTEGQARTAGEVLGQAVANVCEVNLSGCVSAQGDGHG